MISKDIFKKNKFKNEFIFSFFFINIKVNVEFIKIGFL